MAQPRKPKKVPAAKKPARGRPEISPERAKLVGELVEVLRRAREQGVGANATFEQRRDADFEIMRDAVWESEDDELRGSITDAEEIDVGGKKFRRLEQASSATYFGRFGAHFIEEALYREVGVRNGPTLKPVELRAGIVEHMTPDMADRRPVDCRPQERTTGWDVANSDQRAVQSSAVHVTEMGGEIADAAADLERASRNVEMPPCGVASVSCGLDRMSVRMTENVDGAPRTRAEPYERTPPPANEHHYRKAWVGSVTAYDAEGEELRT